MISFIIYPVCVHVCVFVFNVSCSTVQCRVPGGAPSGLRSGCWGRGPECHGDEWWRPRWWHHRGAWPRGQDGGSPSGPPGLGAHHRGHLTDWAEWVLLLVFICNVCNGHFVSMNIDCSQISAKIPLKSYIHPSIPTLWRVAKLKNIISTIVFFVSWIK